MLETLRQVPFFLNRHREAPLLKEREVFLSHLQRQGTSRGALLSMSNELLHVIRILCLNKMRNVSLEEIRRAADRFVLEEQSNPRARSYRCTRTFFIYAAKKWLRFHGCLKMPVPPPVPFAENLDQFARYMREEQGLSPYSVDSHCSKTSMFLRWVGDRRRSLATVRVEDVDDFLAYLGRNGWNRKSVSVATQALRAFFRCAGIRGWCAASLAKSIEGPKIYKYEALPEGPSWEEVQKLLRSVKGQLLEPSKWFADLAVDEAGGYAILLPTSKRSVKSRSGCDLNVFAADVSGAPIESESRVESAIRTCLHAEQGLICLAINRIVTSAQVPGWVRKVSAVVYGAELVNAGVGLTARQARLRCTSVGRRIHEVPCLEKKVWGIPNRKMKAGGILMIGVSIPGHHGTLHIEIPHWREPYLGSRGAGRIERLEDRAKEVAVRVGEGLHEPGAPIFLIAIKVEPSQLPGSHPEFVAEKVLLEPEGVETRGVGTHQIARIGERSDLAAKVGSRLPQPCCVKPKPLPFHQAIKINVDRSAHSFPPGLGLLYSAAGVALHIGDIEEVEGDSFFRKVGSFASPVSKKKLPGADNIRRRRVRFRNNRVLRQHWQNKHE
jgi:hypothetical protein